MIWNAANVAKFLRKTSAFQAAIVLMTPGLSVIIEPIKESRRIFQRMNSYAIYRIAETLTYAREVGI